MASVLGYKEISSKTIHGYREGLDEFGRWYEFFVNGKWRRRRQEGETSTE